jgi:hypothetical protein
LELHIFNDEIIYDIFKIIITPDISYLNASLFVKYIIYTKIQNLKQISSRFLYSSIFLFENIHPKCIINELIIPILKINIGNPQFEIINKIIEKMLSKDNLQILLHEILYQNDIIWNEHFFLLMKNILNTNEIKNDNLSIIILKMNELSIQFKKSIKFSSLLLFILQKFDVGNFVDLIKLILSNNETFIKKSCFSILEKKY